MHTKKRSVQNNTGLDLSDLIPSKSPEKPAYTERNLGRLLEFYLLGEITKAEDYADWFDLIRNCGPNDVIKIHFNSEGGDLYTAIQFMRVLVECQGLTIASSEGACMSAATLIFLACDRYEVSAHTAFMIHNYSGAAFGKGGEMIDQLNFESKWAETIFKDAYTDFLTPKEITAVLKGQDLWMSAEDVITRLNSRQERLDALEKAKETKDSQSTDASG
jgi:ATP-dependent protease ClpP protease subunit